MQDTVMKIGVQLFIGEEHPHPEKVRPIENGDGKTSIFVKPVGGLWTSTWDVEKQTSAWVEWCEGENFGEPHTVQWHLLTPQTDVRIATIDSLADFRALLKKYPRLMRPELSMLGRFLDYEKMSQDYDALHLTEAGQWQTHLSLPDNLYGWDCESTLWFRWCFTRVEQIPKERLW